MDLRPPDVSANSRRPVSLLLARYLDRGRHHLDAGLSARRPSLFAGGAPVDASQRALGGAACQSRRWRSLRLALALRGPARPLEAYRFAGEDLARVSAAWRLLHVRRFLERGRV